MGKTIAAVAAILAIAASPAMAADAARGKDFYYSYCLSCHDDPPVGGPETAANQPSVIKNAINTVAAMNFMRGVFSDADLADIAAYIAQAIGGGSGGGGPPVPAFDYSDLWWNPSESGWGFNIIQHSSNVIFAVMYTYQAPNRPMWFVFPGGTWTSPSTYTGTLHRVNGSPGNVPFRAGSVVSVGTITLLFTDSSHANLTYSVDGVQVTKSITRQPF